MQFRTAGQRPALDRAAQQWQRRARLEQGAAQGQTAQSATLALFAALARLGTPDALETARAYVRLTGVKAALAMVEEFRLARAAQ